ncbi:MULTISPECIES: DNA-binding protein [unclassified Burkholderia]|uniref:DNA-binding protein n=1 Tax=unclassified Burkholderia TaxID=2613784 RepID=UPI000759245A|nr:MULTISPECIES: DNA-binding protein [unclassified Burkholderia]KWE61308.1 DNA-binding protein [Burkholderia sp. MSMB2157WGS]
MTTTPLTATQARRPLTTEELAELLSIRPQSIRKRYCQTGAYFSIRPVKAQNGRLFWPADSFEKLTGGQ